VTYDWDFDGDGVFDLQTTTPRQSHRYPEDGRPSVRVRVTDDAGATADSEPIRLHVRNRPPHVLSIDWDPSHPSDGQEVTFSAQVEDPDGTVERWAWTFNGGSGSDESEPTYAFDRDGTFTVRLVAFDNDGMPSPPMEVEVAVANTAPVADFSYTEVGEGLIQFDASLSYDPSPLGRIVHVAWDFGDGTECPGQPSGCGDQTRDAPLHRFLSPGAYTVKLFVIDDEGKIGRLSRQLVIE